MNKEIIDRYERYLKKKKMNENTIRNYIYDLKAFDLFVNKPLFEVIEDDIRDYIQDKKIKRNSINRINFSITTLSSFYKYAKRNNYIKYNPTDNINRLKLRQEETPYLTTFQIYETRRRLANEDIQLQVFFGLIISSSPMKTAIQNLAWRNIKWDKKYAIVEVDEERSSILFLDDYTIDKLKELRKERKDMGIKRKWVFLTKHKGLNSISDATINYWLNKIAEIGELDKLTLAIVKKTHLHYSKAGRRLSDEKIEKMLEYKLFPTELRGKILEEVEHLKD